VNASAILLAQPRNTPIGTIVDAGRLQRIALRCELRCRS